MSPVFILLMAFFGAFLVMHGMYQQKLLDVDRTSRVEYKFVPRTLFEEQMDFTEVSSKMRPMFENQNVTIGGSSMSPRPGSRS
jgi:hypothetical protein